MKKCAADREQGEGRQTPDEEACLGFAGTLVVSEMIP
jgi:hypothetical protein